MKKIILFLTFVVLTFFASAQWQQTNGPFGGGVYSTAIIGNHVFASTSNGVYLSTNNGASWSLANSGLTNTNVSRLAVLGSNIFAGTYGEGVFMSSNYGTNWNPVNNGLPNNARIYTITVSGNDIYAFAYQHGVFKSTNNGNSWFAVGSAFPTNIAVRSLSVIGTNVFAATTLGIYMSSGISSTWNIINDPLIFNRSFFSLNTLGGNIFAGAENGLIFLSTDTGATWANINNGFNGGSIYSITVDGTNIYAGTDNGVFGSSNNGTDWDTLNSGLIFTPVYSLSINGNSFFAGTEYGMYYSSNSGTNWIEANTGLKNCFIYSLLADGSNIYAGTYNKGVYISADSGANWTPVNNGLSENMVVLSLAANGSSVFASLNASGLYKTSNNGTNWIHLNNGLTSPYIKALAISGTNIFAGTSQGVFLSTDDGANWTPINNGLSSLYISSLAVSGTNIFAGTFYGEIFLSSDTGATWTAVNNGLPLDNSNAGDVKSIIVSDSNIFAALWTYGVYLSTDNGNNWHPINTGLPATFFNSLYLIGNQIFAVTENGLFMTSNNGAFWNDVSAGLTDLNIRCITKNNSDLYVGTYQSSVWKRSTSDFVFNYFSGNVFNDINNNGIRDINEPGISDVLLKTFADNWMHNTEPNGNYNAYSTSVSDSIIIINPSLYATVTPLGYAVNNQDTGKNFAVHFLPNINDLKVTVTNVTAARPGFDDVIKITYKNVGTTTVSGNVSLDFDNNSLSYIASIPTHSSINANTINWNFTNLQPLEHRDITVQFNIFSTVPLGTVLNFTGIVYPIAGDSDQTNNTNTLNQIVNGSYDPNEKEVDPWYGMTPQQLANGQELTYTIHFQNTGTDTAFTVVIIDTLTSGLDVETFQFLSSSHPCTFNIRDMGIVEFYFNNILLPDSNVNYVGSNGFVKYSIKPKSTLQLGDNITNTAYIYFDFNLPVQTNTTNTLIATGIVENVQKENFLKIYPNPAKDRLTIEILQKFNLEILNIQGQTILQKQILQGKTDIDVSGLAKGLYILRLSSNDRTEVTKFVKE